jgi:hypothetical protein
MLCVCLVYGVSCTLDPMGPPIAMHSAPDKSQHRQRCIVVPSLLEATIKVGYILVG